MKSILIIILLVVLVESEDWCPVIKPNGVFNGLGIYQHMVKSEQGDVSQQYRMYNKHGNEWNFILNTTALLERKVIIEPVFNSLEVIEKDVLARFGAYAMNPFEDCVCSVDPLMTDSTIVMCKCQTIMKKFSNVTHFQNLFFMKSEISDPLTADDVYVLAFNRDNITEKAIAFNPVVNGSNGAVDCMVKKCYVPKFIGKLEKDLAQNIQGVVSIDENILSGYLLFFSIDGRPMYCFTSENDELSEECKSKNKFIPIFDECFAKEGVTPEKETESVQVSTSEPIGSSQSPPNEETSGGTGWLIIAVIIVIVLIIMGVVVYFILKGAPKPTVDVAEKSKSSDHKSSPVRQRPSLKKKSDTALTTKSTRSLP